MLCGYSKSILEVLEALQLGNDIALPPFVCKYFLNDVKNVEFRVLDYRKTIKRGCNSPTLPLTLFYRRNMSK